MNVLRRPCLKLIQRSYELGRASTLTNHQNAYQVNILSTHTRGFASATTVVEGKKEDGTLKRLAKKLFKNEISKTRLRMSSYTMYEAVADQIKYQDMFLRFKLPNTFNSWFLITELHVWMLIVRAMAEGSEKGQDGRFVRNCIVEAMWNDVSKRAKELNPGNTKEIRNQIHLLSEQFQAALITYDEGIMSDDRGLANSLWRRFFEMKCENYENLELLVKYVRMQVQEFDHLNRQDFIDKTKIKWINLNEVQ